LHGGPAERRLLAARLSKTWLLAIPLAGVVGGLALGAEALRLAAYPGWANAADLTRLLVFLAWGRLAWRWSANLERKAWKLVTRAGVCAGTVLMILI
jgi:hypothetical protein